MGGEHGTVPFKYRTYYGDSIPSDNYYADYDDDWTWEVYVGRISGSSSTQFSTAIDKIIDYETDPPTSNYAKDVLLNMDAFLAATDEAALAQEQYETRQEALENVAQAERQLVDGLLPPEGDFLAIIIDRITFAMASSKKK